jgi:HEAT repeat protein
MVGVPAYFEPPRARHGRGAAGIDSLVKGLASGDAEVRRESREALIALGFRATKKLTEALGSEDGQVRWEAAKALSEIADPTSTEALVAALDDPRFDVRWLAADALIRLEDDALVPVLAEIISNSESAQFRDAARRVLLALAEGPLGNILRPVVEAIERSDAATTAPTAAREARQRLLRAS